MVEITSCRLTSREKSLQCIGHHSHVERHLRVDTDPRDLNVSESSSSNENSLLSTLSRRGGRSLRQFQFDVGTRNRYSVARQSQVDELIVAALSSTITGENANSAQSTQITVPKGRRFLFPRLNTANAYEAGGWTKALGDFATRTDQKSAQSQGSMLSKAMGVPVLGPTISQANLLGASLSQRVKEGGAPNSTHEAGPLENVIKGNHLLPLTGGRDELLGDDKGLQLPGFIGPVFDVTLAASFDYSFAGDYAQNRLLRDYYDTIDYEESELSIAPRSSGTAMTTRTQTDHGTSASAHNTDQQHASAPSAITRTTSVTGAVKGTAIRGEGGLVESVSADTDIPASFVVPHHTSGAVAGGAATGRSYALVNTPATSHGASQSQAIISEGHPKGAAASVVHFTSGTKSAASQSQTTAATDNLYVGHDGG